MKEQHMGILIKWQQFAMAKRDSHQKVKNENRNMLLASRNPMPLRSWLLSPAVQTTDQFLPKHKARLFRLEESFFQRYNTLQPTKYSNTQYECCQHCSARKPGNPLISSFSRNVPFYRLHYFYYQSKYISILNARTGKICAGHT